jgi:lipopolysaccharide transport system ATP-binding protein
VKPAVTFEGVSKKFRRGERHDSLRDLLPALVRGVFQRESTTELTTEEFWALRDVSFEVRAGEALGIIGHNGAGKSTALKLLTRILKPTTGRCVVSGRVGALIEVAAGFHRDLTGRENVYMQGAIMGMKRSEITERLDDILDFAGIGAFADTPTKRYSSGMNARLGFSIAAHLNPSVLLIDEVLAVGDTAFQQRCFMRMHDFLRGGAAIVFVSHNMNAILDLCTKALLLNDGHTQEIGKPSDVVAAYLSDPSGCSQSRRRDRALTMVESTLVPSSGSTGEVTPGTECTFVARFLSSRRLENVVFTFSVRHSQTNMLMYSADSPFIGGSPLTVDANAAVEVRVTFVSNLLRGSYYIEMHAFDPPTRTIHEWRSPAAIFEVKENASHSGTAALFPACSVSTGVTPQADVVSSLAHG